VYNTRRLESYYYYFFLIRDFSFRTTVDNMCSIRIMISRRIRRDGSDYRFSDQLSSESPGVNRWRDGRRAVFGPWRRGSRGKWVQRGVGGTRTPLEMTKA